jgi:acetylornithine deacetylase
MSAKTTDRATSLLCDLIRFDTVNPMGRDTSLVQPVERPVVEYLEKLFEAFDVPVTRQAVGEQHENLVVEIPGESDGPALLFDAHMDTVSANDWVDQAFSPRVEGDVILGRGACDDKGPMVSMLLPLLDMLESDRRPPAKVVFLASGDEEHGATGIQHFVSTTDTEFALGVFAEPTRNMPVVQHKGVARWDITAHGKSAHTSQPELGLNAIHEMMRVIEAIESYQDSLQAAHENPLVTGPRITPSIIQGGIGRNTVPDQCTVCVDFRIVPGLDPHEERQRLIDFLAGLDVEVSHGETLVAVNPVSTSPDHPMVHSILKICGAVLNEQVSPQGAPYGTNACRWPGDIPAVVMGPGDIGNAHAIDEYITIPELIQAAEIYGQCMKMDWGA